MTGEGHAKTAASKRGSGGSVTSGRDIGREDVGGVVRVSTG